MKINRLDLIAFGPFTDKQLDLSGTGCGLHIVFGPNEAGKSTTLRAVRQWLFGIPQQSPDDFVHPYKKLQLGGQLQLANGETMDLIRRKGAKNSLRDVSGEPVDELVLRRHLGGLDALTFQQRFGIDHAELLAGGRAIVEGGGGLSEILYAAGTGIAGLASLRKKLIEQSQVLFTPQGRNRKINFALGEFTAAKKLVKDLQVPTARWVQIDAKLQEFEQSHRDIDLSLGELRQRQSRLERYEKALPLMARRNHLSRELSMLQDVPLLPDSFPSDRAQVQTELKSARRSREEAAGEIARLEKSIAGLDLPTDLLQQRAVIVRLHTDLGSYQKAAKDRGSIVARLNGIERQIGELLSDLGKSPDLQEASRLRLSRAERHQIQSLAADSKVHVERHAEAERSLDRLRAEFDEVESQQDTMPPEEDLEPLSKAIQRVREQGRLQQEYDDAVDLRDQLRQQTETQLGQLPLFDGTLEQLRDLAPPGVETIDRFDDQLSTGEQAIRELDQRIMELEEQRSSSVQRLQQLREEFDVPSEQDLEQLRRRRNEGWTLVRHALSSGGVEDSKTAQFVADSGEADLALAFQASMASVDKLADRLRNEAERVAEQARLVAEEREFGRRLSELQERRSGAEATYDRIHAQWSAAWTALAAPPLPPREMRDWLRRQQELALKIVELGRLTQRADQLERQISQWRAELCGVLERIGRPLADPQVLLDSVLEHCESVAQRIAAENQQRREYETRYQQLMNDVREAQANAVNAAEQLDRWKSQWRQAVAMVGLDEDAAPPVANAVIASVDELGGLHKEAADLKHRIAGIDSDTDAFLDRVQQLSEEQIAVARLEQVVVDRFETLDAAIADQATLTGWQKQLKAEQAKRERAVVQVDTLGAELEAMCDKAGCDSIEELPQVEQRSLRRGQLERDLESVEQQLNELAAGTECDEFVRNAGEFGPDELTAELHSLAGRIEQLDREKSEVAESIGAQRADLRRIDGSGRAAEALEQVEHLAAQIRSDSQHYLRLRISAELLGRAMERYREKNQGPILRRAGQLFGQLTLGSFTGLRPEFDDRGEAILEAVRSGGQRVHVAGLSEGSESQLYLALRLSLLESYLDDAEPIPFIVDDILKDFDDERTVAALQALAELAERTQVIVFTHHRHVLDLAREQLAENVVSICSLGDDVSVSRRRRQKRQEPAGRLLF